MDSYLTDYVLVKVIRKHKLKKDKNIQIFDAKLIDKTTGRDFRVFNDHADIISKVIESNELADGGLHIRVDATNMEEGIALAKKKIKRLRPEWKDAEIERMLGFEGAIKRGETEFLQPILQQNADVDKTRWILAGIKMAYEYTCERLGDAYTKDDVAIIISKWLYAAVQGKREYTDQEYMEIRNYCNVIDTTVFKLLFDSPEVVIVGRPLYIIQILMDKDNKLICAIRILDEDLLTFTVLVSMDGLKYLSKGGTLATLILKDGQRVDV